MKIVKRDIGYGNTDRFFVLGDGRELCQSGEGDCLSLTIDGQLASGYDQSFPLDLTLLERAEIANYMIAMWQKWALNGSR